MREVIDTHMARIMARIISVASRDYADEVRDGFTLPVQSTLEHQAGVWSALGTHFLMRGFKARLKMTVDLEASAQTIGPPVLLGQCQTPVRR